MKRNFFSFSFFVFVIFISGNCFSKDKQSESKSSQHQVIIISWDGFGLNVYEKTKPLENLEALIKSGAFALSARAVIPTVTLPNHASMLSGVDPQIHKILWNDWVPSKGTILVPTIFDLAKSNKLSTAMIVGKEKFKHFNVTKSVDHFILKTDALSVAQAAKDIILKHKPQLMFIHFPDPDFAGHKFGWLSPEQTKAVKDCDAALKIIIDAVKRSRLEKTVSWIITADHGGHGRSHGTAQDSDQQIPWILSGRGVSFSKIKKPISTVDTAAQAALFLGLKIPKSWSWQGLPVLDY